MDSMKPQDAVLKEQTLKMIASHISDTDVSESDKCPFTLLSFMKG